jgi:peptidylprolyl isomerase
MNKQSLIYIAAIIAALAVLISILKKDTANPKSPTEVAPEAVRTETKPTPKMQIDTAKQYTATLTTSAGDITIKLLADKTPITVNNFVSLARQKFYNNTIFHRVISGFMIQGGDPKGDGTGGPGYQFADEEFEGEYARGTVAMANAGANTNGSQFFIMHEDNLEMPKNYVIFGEVAEGLDVVDQIAESEVEPSASGEISKPVEPIKINSVKIEGK